MSEKKIGIPGLKKKKDGSYSISIECPSGNVSPTVLREVTEIAEKYAATVHLTSVQKIMLLDLNEEAGKDAIERLKVVGARVKTRRTLSQAMVCVGKPYCPLALQETMPLASFLYEKVSEIPIPPKLKMAISGCPACCTWANLVDIGFVGTSDGFKLFVGGHGGYKPVVGQAIGLVKDNEEAVKVVKKVASIFVKNVDKKGRLSDVIKKMGMDEFRKELGI